MDKSQNEKHEYSAPEVVDYGTLQELTAANGHSFVDAPIGTPVGNTAGSKPISS